MSLIIKMDAIKTEEHLRKSIPYIMNEKRQVDCVLAIPVLLRSRLWIHFF